MKTYKLRIPKRFYQDHCDRGLLLDGYDCDGIIATTKTHFTVLLTERDAHELLDDAWFYSDSSWIQDDPAHLGLVMSARATHKAVCLQLVAQGFPFNDYGKTSGETKWLVQDSEGNWVPRTR
jgi:hypothetical protein